MGAIEAVIFEWARAAGGGSVGMSAPPDLLNSTDRAEKGNAQKPDEFRIGPGKALGDQYRAVRPGAAGPRRTWKGLGGGRGKGRGRGQIGRASCRGRG